MRLLIDKWKAILMTNTGKLLAAGLICVLSTWAQADDLTDAARDWLGRVGYDPVYGARPLKRAVQKYLQDPLADAILSGDVTDGATINVNAGDGQLELTFD